MRILICGDRFWNKPQRVLEELSRLHQAQGVTCVIEGEAPGADQAGREAARKLNISWEAYPALWKRYGRSAGPIRNRQMIVEGKPDYALAFHPDITKSRGTKDMLAQLTKAGISYELFNE